MRLRLFPKTLSLALPLLLLGFAGPATLAQSTITKTDARAENPEEFSRVPGLFDVDLPKTVEKFNFKMLVHPHFGDLLHRDYIRVPVGLRLGVSDHTEISAEVESYFTHGLKGHGAGSGVDSIRLGAKHQWHEWLKPEIDTSVGFNATFPVGRPPLDLTDGHNHFAPYISFSKHLPDHPRLTPFVTVGPDLMWASGTPGSFTKNQTHSNSMSVSGGFLYDRDTIKYTLVTGYTTTSLIGAGNKQYVSINPSVLFELPRSLTFHSDGIWIFGFGVRANFGPDGTEFGTSAKLRGEFSFLRRFRASPKETAKRIRY